MFLTPVDIANRALQHCGATRIDPALGFAENTKNSAECFFVYDKLRRAELRRNVWRFAIRRAVLRAIDFSSVLILAPSLWVGETNYPLGAIVSDETGRPWISMTGNNIEFQPETSLHWQQYFGPMTVFPYDSATSYFAGDLVYVFIPETSDIQVFYSLVSANEAALATANWVQIGGAAFPTGVATSGLSIIYPIGAGASAQSTRRNVYQLPANFLREAPQDPKAGSYSLLGGPSGRPYTDWDLEGNYIVTSQSDPIVYRFVADMVEVAGMDDMFCEALAARMGMEICETVTQSGTKLKTIASVYQKNITEARLVNGIETGPIEPPVDDYIAVRA